MAHLYCQEKLLFGHCWAWKRFNRSVTKSFRIFFLFLAKANEALEEVRNAEVMVNMTKEAADKAVMRAMDALARARNANDRMDKLIQVLLL